MDEIKLIKPTKEYADDIMTFRQDLLDEAGEFAGCCTLDNCTTADKWLNNVEYKEKNCIEGGVTSNSYIAVRLSDKKIVGITELRHHINNPMLSFWGGHIGYTVRPSERKKGYAKEMLLQNLQNCKDRGLKKILIVCDCDNIASEKTIIANGGVFEKEINVDNKTMKRFWVTL